MDVAVSPNRSTPDSAAIDTVADFLRTEAARLRCGLRRDEVAAVHENADVDAAHDAWLEIIAAVRMRDEADARMLAELYGLHGNLAARLERGLDPSLDAVVARRVRVLFAQRLTELTEHCVHALRGSLTSAGAVPAQ